MNDLGVRQGNMEKELRRLGSKLDELSAKAKAAGAEVRADERELVEDLTKKRDAAQVKLDELQSAAEGKWDTLKSGLESAYGELEAAIKKLVH